MNTLEIEAKIAEGCRGFLNDLDVRWVHAKRKWVLLDDLIWVGKQDDLIVVPKGFETDFASTPRLLQSIFPATGAWTKAAVVHDFLCDGINERYRRVLAMAEAHEISVDEAQKLVRPALFGPVDTDNIFRLIMVEEGTSETGAQFGWVGVRLGAAWNPARRPGILLTLWEVVRTIIAYLGLAFVACFLVVLFVAGVLSWLS